MPLSFYAKIERTLIANEESILWPPYICNHELVLYLYYWNLRSAVGVLRVEDKVLCLSSGTICVLIIVLVVIKSIKNK